MPTASLLEKGVVSQAGTYEELIEKEGPFADLARRQISEPPQE